MRTHPAGGECAALEATPKQNELVQEDTTLETVSYTHLTLPTKLEV